MENKITAESIYIHIPFCKTKCPYCDFASWAKKEYLIDKYFDALLLEIKTKCEAYFNMSFPGLTRESSHNATGISSLDSRFRGNDIETKPLIKTIFIGGGTPSLISPEYYEKLFSELRKHFVIDKDCEITLELNPGTAKDDFLEGYKKLDINRISIGAQSFNENILETLGRKHSVADTFDAIEKVKKAGIINFNLDFIYAVPGITKKIWKDSIYRALEFEPKHISAYSLIIEPNTPFEQIYKNPKLLPSDDFSCELYFELCSILKENNFVHYEVSNFAKPGYESKHNINYWLAKEFFAFGTGAHRFLNKLRTSNLKDLETYISYPNLESIIDFQTDQKFEKIMLNSRLNTGFELNLIKEISAKSTQEITKTLSDLSNEGYLELLNNKIHLTDKGLFVNNEILLKLT